MRRSKWGRIRGKIGKRKAHKGCAQILRKEPQIENNLSKYKTEVGEGGSAVKHSIKILKEESQVMRTGQSPIVINWLF